MTFNMLPSTAAIAILSGSFLWATATPAEADHCYHLKNGMIYCYETLPPGRTHVTWNSDTAPPLARGEEWSCNLMSHPRTICVSYDPASNEPPEIPKYLADDPKFGTEVTEN